MQNNYWQSDYYSNEPKYYQSHHPPYQNYYQNPPYYYHNDYNQRYISQSPQMREYIYSKNLNQDRDYYYSLQKIPKPYYDKPHYDQMLFQEQQWQRDSYDNKSFQKKESFSRQQEDMQQEDFIVKDVPEIKITDVKQERQKREFQSRKKRFMNDDKGDQFYTNDQNLDMNFQADQHRTTPANNIQFQHQFFPRKKNVAQRPKYDQENEQVKMELVTALRKLQQAERERNYLKRELQFKELENGQMKKKIKLYNQDLKDFKNFNDQLLERQYTLEEKLNDKDYENKDLQNSNLEFEIQNTELQKQIDQLKYTLQSYNDFSNSKTKQKFKYNCKKDTISFVTEALQNTQENLKTYLQNNSVDRIQQKMIIQVLDDFLLIIKDIQKNTYLGISKYQKILKQILSNIKTGKLQLTPDLQGILEKFQIEIPRPQTHISLKNCDNQQPNNEEFLIIRQQLNKNLKKIIEFFEIQKDKNLKLSEQVDQCNLQYLQMIMDIVMPYNKETTTDKNTKKPKNQKDYLLIQANTENLTSLDDIPAELKKNKLNQEEEDYDDQRIDELDEEDESYEEDEDFQDDKFHNRVRQSLDEFSLNEYGQINQQQNYIQLNIIYIKRNMLTF